VDPTRPERFPTHQELFRRAFRRHATTVAVVTYRDVHGEAVGMTATSICSLSAQPPSLLACINRANRAWPEIQRRSSFGVDLLAASQHAIAEYCAVAGRDKHLDPAWLGPEDPDDTAETPRLRDSLVHFDCTVDRLYEVYSHTVVVGLIWAVRINPRDAPPLLYHDGTYGQAVFAPVPPDRGEAGGAGGR
jgi:flavin reductase (DIM6/NTAB) family NADH-FMN oxidoreductase RutF